MTQHKERADARRNRETILAAADRLFASARDSSAVSMDEVAEAAGVGKGTLFRRFGDRAGLLRSLIEEKQRPLQQAVLAGALPLGPAGTAHDRVRALVGALADFKLENRYLMLALEGGNNPYAGTQYAFWHEHVSSALAAAGVPAERVPFRAHAVLAALRSDLVEYLLSCGYSADAVKAELTLFVGTILPPE